jgi:hypothetical protein
VCARGSDAGFFTTGFLAPDDRDAGHGRPCLPGGAYNPTFFASNANSFPRPARVLLEANGDWTYLRRADSHQEIFSLNRAEQE